jgi:hypothetical protein
MVDMPVRLSKASRSYVQAIAADDPKAKRARRALLAEVREQWFMDLARLYPQAVAAIEDALAPGGSAMLRTSTAKWLIEQRRAMVPEEREAEALQAEAQGDPLAKPPSEMTLEELNQSIARLSILAAEEQAEDAEVVGQPSIFD